MNFKKECERVMDEKFEISKMKDDPFISKSIPGTLKQMELAKSEVAEDLVALHTKEVQELLKPIREVYEEMQRCPTAFLAGQMTEAIKQTLNNLDKEGK